MVHGKIIGFFEQLINRISQSLFLWRKNRAWVAAFTLVELLVSVAIIGILASMAYQALGTSQGDAKGSKAAAVTTNIGTACTRYALANPVSTPTAITFSDIQPYLIINGVQVTGTDQLLQGTGCSNLVLPTLTPSGTMSGSCSIY